MVLQIARNPKYGGYQSELESMSISFFTRKEDWERM